MSNTELLRLDRVKIHSGKTCACKDKGHFDVQLIRSNGRAASFHPFTDLFRFFDLGDQLGGIDEPN